MTLISNPIKILDNKPPIWLMRQAGRYLPEYMAVRKEVKNFLEFCYDVDKATKVTLQPIKRFGFDAAIIFSDILVLPHALGWEVDFKENIGPVALWGTFIIKTKKGDICFIGDSGYNANIFKEIGEKYNILLSLIPIGAYEPRWFMQPVHMNPEEAVLAHLDLRSKFSIASHFDVFQLADEAFNAAPLELQQAIKKHNIQDDKFIIPKVGNFFLFDQNNKLL